MPTSEAAILKTSDITAPHVPLPAQPRAEGVARVSTKLRTGQTVLDKLHQQGSLKLLFPRGHGSAMHAVALNTGGGITGGDKFELSANAGTGCHLVMTTQAAERAYRAQPGEIGQVKTNLSVEAGARLDWLPQETLLFDGAALNRRLKIKLAPDARALMVEPVVFGRIEMGEVVRDLSFWDRVDIVRDGKSEFADRTRLTGDAVAQLAGRATGGGCGAMASLVYAADDAENFLDRARALMPETGGVSLIRDGILFARLLAPDSFVLRQTLLPLIDLLSISPLPRTWMI
jgi:urease accessory protein